MDVDTCQRLAHAPPTVSLSNIEALTACCRQAGDCECFAAKGGAVNSAPQSHSRFRLTRSREDGCYLYDLVLGPPDEEVVIGSSTRKFSSDRFAWIGIFAVRNRAPHDGCYHIFSEGGQWGYELMSGNDCILKSGGHESREEAEKYKEYAKRCARDATVDNQDRYVASPS